MFTKARLHFYWDSKPPSMGFMVSTVHPCLPFFSYEKIPSEFVISRLSAKKTPASGIPQAGVKEDDYFQSITLFSSGGG
jgi:hypothetical protein